MKYNQVHTSIVVTKNTKNNSVSRNLIYGKHYMKNIYTTIQKLFFFKKLLFLYNKDTIKLTKRDSIDIYNVTRFPLQINAYLLNCLSFLLFK